MVLSWAAVAAGMVVAGPACGFGILVGSRFFDLAGALTSLPVLDGLIR